MTRAALTALLSHWRRHPLQFVTLILGLALATALWSGVQAINAEARKSYDDAADVLGGGGLREIVAAGGEPISVETYVTLRRAGWLVSPVVDGWIASDGGRVRLLGVDPLTLPPGRTSEAVSSVDLTAFYNENGTILTSPSTAERLQSFGQIVQPVEGLASGLAIIELTAAERIAEQEGFNRLLLHPDQPLRQPPLSDINPNLSVRSPASADDLARLTDSFHLNLTAFGLLSFAVGLFIVNAAVGLAFEERRGVFRTLRALGMTARRLVTLFTLELLLFALLAGAIGIVLGYLIAAFLLPDVAATLRGLYGATIDGALTLSPFWWFTGIGIAVLGTALASLTSLLRLARLGPLAAAKPRAWVRSSDQTTIRQLILSVLCFAVGLAATFLGDGLLSGFLLLGGLLLAAALALPAVLSLIIAFAARMAEGIGATWFWADTRQQLPGLSLALMALLLALAANIGVGTMVQSFRLTFTGWLDQRLASELYITAEAEDDVPALLEFLRPMTDAILPIWSVDAEILGAPGEIFGIVDHETYRENWPLLSAEPDVWDRIAAGAGALVNEQLARREDLGTGDTISLPGGLREEIVGVYSDYGNPLGQVILPNAVLAATYPKADRLRFGLRLEPERVDKVRTALVDDFGLPQDNIVDQAALKQFSLDVFERTFAVTAALNVLTLAVAGIAMLTSLLTLAAMRLPQLAPVWAMGFTRRRLAVIEITRAIVLALFTFVLSIPVGLCLAWVLLAVINVEAFGWRLPMYVFPLDWLWLGGLSLAAAGLASLWPARRLATRPPADLIRVFAHER